MSEQLNRNPKAYDVSRQHVIVRAEGADTNGVCAILEMHHPQDCGPPLHIHTLEDEIFYVLKGKYLFQIGESKRTVSPGEVVIAQRGVAHSFRSLGPELGKMLVYLTPAGGEAYFEKMSKIGMEDPERSDKCKTLDTEYGMTILGRGV